MGSGYQNAASTGRTHGSSDQQCQNVQKILANMEPSTHAALDARNVRQTLPSWLLIRACRMISSTIKYDFCSNRTFFINTHSLLRLQSRPIMHAKRLGGCLGILVSGARAG